MKKRIGWGVMTFLSLGMSMAFSRTDKVLQTGVKAMVRNRERSRTEKKIIVYAVAFIV